MFAKGEVHVLSGFVWTIVLNFFSSDLDIKTNTIQTAGHEIVKFLLTLERPKAT